MHNGMIIAEVNKRTTVKVGDVPFDVFQKHWIETGKLWAKECRDQGLEETAKTIDKHIEWFERQLV